MSGDDIVERTDRLLLVLEAGVIVARNGETASRERDRALIIIAAVLEIVVEELRQLVREVSESRAS